jgi:hypothetical protein
MIIHPIIYRKAIAGTINLEVLEIVRIPPQVMMATRTVTTTEA